MNPAEHEPYLSVVVTCRNDDHGGSPVTRLQALVNSFNAQCRRTGLDAEVVVVEWNPPSDRPSLKDMIRWPADLACRVRFITVPEDVHRKLQFSDMLPLFQMIAKNVGVRRAAGQFVLCTNIDIIFSDELIDYVASHGLRPGVLYRVNRHDIESDFPVDAPLSLQSAYCRDHQLRVHRQQGSYPVHPGGEVRTLAADIVQQPGIRLGAGWHVCEMGATHPFRWAAARAEVMVGPDAAEADTLEFDVESNPCASNSWCDLVVEGPDGDCLTRTRVAGRRVIAVPFTSHGLYTLAMASDPEYTVELPYFETRAGLMFRVHAIGLKRRDEASAGPVSGTPRAGMSAPSAAATVSNDPADAAVDLPLEAFTPADGGVTLAMQPDLTLLLKTSARKWSYAAELRATASGTGEYQFVVEYVSREGNVSIGVLSGTRRRWLGTPTRRTADDDLRSVSVTVRLIRGQRHWLVISNDHVEDDSHSEVVIRRVALQGPRTARYLQMQRRSVRTSKYATSVFGTLRRGRRLLTRFGGPSAGSTAAGVDPVVELPLDTLRPADADVTRVIEADGTLSLTTAGRKWSYAAAVEATAPATGRYQFGVEYVIREGNISIGVVSASTQRWLASTFRHETRGDSRLISVTVWLLRGDRHSIVISNDHAEDGLRSSVVIRHLTVRAARAALYVQMLANAARASKYSNGPSGLTQLAPEFRARIDDGIVRETEAQGPAAFESSVEVPLAKLERADDDVSLVPESAGALGLTTGTRRTYAVEMAATAPRSGEYQFTIEYVPRTGDISMAVLSGTRRWWLGDSVMHDVGDGGSRSAIVTVRLLRGQRHWIVISNNHPDDGSRSEVVLRRLIVSGPDVARYLDGRGPTSKYSSLAYETVWRANRWRMRIRRTIVDRALEKWHRAGEWLTGRKPGHIRDGTYDGLHHAAGLPARIKDGMTRALARWTVASVREQIVESSERLVALEAENLELRAAHSALQLEANQRAILVPLAPHAAFLRRFRPPSLHLNGCGDFQLTAREHWLEFHGYPELETFSMNIDGLFSYIAHYGGLTECVLEEPCCIYHLEHEKGSGWTPEGEQALRRRIDERGIPWLDATIVSTWASYMQWLGRPMLFNGSDWGFAAYAFEETTIDASDRSLA